MGWIMGANGWRQLEPPNCIPPVPVPTLLEQMGVKDAGPYKGAVIDQFSNAVKRWMLPYGDPRRINSETMHRMMGEKNWVPEWNTRDLQVRPYWDAPKKEQPVQQRNMIFRVRG